MWDETADRVKAERREEFLIISEDFNHIPQSFKSSTT